MKLYLITETAAKYLMRAPAIRGGYVITGEANQYLPTLCRLVDGSVCSYLAKLPEDMADSLAARWELTPADAQACLSSIDESLAHSGRPGTMGKLADGAAHLAGIVRDDLLRVASV